MHRLFLQILLALAVIVMPVANAQSSMDTDTNPANCNEMIDPDLKFQMGVCASYAGCGLVMSFHRACTKTKKFLNNLKEIMTRDESAAKEAQASDTSLFGRLKSFVGGGKKDVTPSQVFEASLTDKMRAMETRDPELKDKTNAIREGISKAGNQVLTETISGTTKTYIGDVKDGKANGWGTEYWSNGVIKRAEFKNGQTWGPGDRIAPDDTRQLGEFVANRMNGSGAWLMPDGRQYKGTFTNGEVSGAGEISRDGVPISRGVYDKGNLTVGTIFDAAGGQQQVDKFQDARQAAEAQQKLAYERQQLEDAERLAAAERQKASQAAAEQRRKEEAAAVERAYRESLNTMNAGQLFAKADELSSNGDSAKAREVLRTLVSRFPNHPLAAQAAAQMTSGSATNAQSGGVNAQSSNGQRVSSAQKGMTCREATDELGNNFILFFAPTDAAGKLSDADKLMQYVYVSKKLQQLVNQHSACRDSPYSKTVISGLESWQSQCRSARGSDCVNGRDLVGYGSEADKIIERLLSTPAATNNSGDLQGQNCERAIAKQEQEFEALNRKPVPPGGTPPLMRVMWMTSEKIKLIRANCPNTATYQSQIRDLQSAYDQSDKACGQMMAGNTCPGPNPYR